MAKNCILCGKKEGWTDINYAGIKVISRGNHAFPARIKELILPGEKKFQYLCADCANNFKVECKVHGIIYDDSYSMGFPPICKKCEIQLTSINNGTLPKGFNGLITLDQIQKKSGEKIDSGFLAFSDSNEFHVINKKVLYSTDIEAAIPKITSKDDLIFFFAMTPKSRQVDYCLATLNRAKIHKYFFGAWIKFWKESILKLLQSNGNEKTFGIVSSKSIKIAENQIGSTSKEVEVVFCALIDDELKTIPDIGLPPIESLKSLDQESNSMKLFYEVDEIPQLYHFDEFQKCDNFNSIKELKKYLPNSRLSKKIEFGDFYSMGIFNAKLYPSPTKKRVLIELDQSNIRCKILPDKKKITFTKGFSYCNTHLLITESFEDFLTFSSISDNDCISSRLQKLEKLEQIHDFLFGIFLDGEDLSIAHTLQIYDNGFIINNGDPIEFNNIQKIALNKKNSGISNLNIKYMLGNQETTLKLISPESLAYEVWEILEVRSVESKLNLNDTINLYKEYNDIKKKNLLIGLYTDIILFNKELNRKISMEELASQIPLMDSSKFYDNKKLYEATTEKLLLMSIFLPKIKQNFEYLATFYPYYQLNNELEFISETFGEKVADAMKPFERKRIIPFSRRNVRNIQMEMQRIFSELERAIHPVEQLFAKEEIQKTISSKITRHISTGGQLLLVGSLITTGAATGVGVLGGMLGIRAVGDLLNAFQKDRGDAAMIKKASETMFSWWQVFLNLLPVSIYEASELISEENNRCLLRDKQIISQFPPGKKSMILSRLHEVLHQKITKGTKNQFLEIFSGTGIRLYSIAEEIEYAIDNNLNSKISTTINSLPLP